MRVNPFIAAIAVGLSFAYFYSSASGTEKEIPALNQAVLQFAIDHRGKQVGNGECWTLAADALSHAGAARPGRNHVPLGEFGRELTQGEALLPGDIVQFEHAKFVHKTKKAITNMSMEHHTAIVSEVDGTHITMLHQNYNGEKSVGSVVINLADRTEGSVKFFRPKPKK